MHANGRTPQPDPNEALRRLLAGEQKVPIIGQGRKVRMVAVPQGKPDNSCEVMAGVRRYVVVDRNLAEAIAAICMGAGMIGDNTTDADTARRPEQPEAITIHLHNEHGQATRRSRQGALLVDVFLPGWNQPGGIVQEYVETCTACDGTGWQGHPENACPACQGEGVVPAEVQE